MSLSLMLTAATTLAAAASVARAQVPVRFENAAGRDVIITWVPYAANAESHDYRIAAGDTLSVNTIFTHRFDARVADDATAAATTYIVKQSLPHTVVLDPVAHAACLSGAAGADCTLDAAVSASDSDDAKLWRERGRVEQMRLDMNDRQSSRLPKYTPLGYHKTRVPPWLYEKIMAHHNAVTFPEDYSKEGWIYDEINVNIWEVDTYIRQMPQALRDEIIEHFRRVLAEWVGLQPDELEYRSLYGIRRYPHNSILAMHVDRPETHVVSAIVHVARENMHEPWLLEVRGHDGKVAHYDTEPGSATFYESATVPHGRPQRMRGDAFFNFFIHFAPVGWEERIKPLLHDEL